ncbi:MAG: carboxylating nicotinate-nucleotide diphosphorylase [Rhodospirillales bacterium]|nr:carboxylating nicotinate-nucleotide diphosphorylase [Rhodospirillales bacterium]MCW8970881.1 carboxylating nicotinate-nucleotide diphosphorylase [Rhodospirillales bacterium]MCW9002326.1 carboxylating nicotinate-nucleotide diphosphorylase [Rhodospirillales bacterium]
MTTGSAAPTRSDLEAASRVIKEAIAEDIGRGDITSGAVIPEDARFRGVMAARQPMVVAGMPFVVEVFSTLAPGASVEVLVADGDAVSDGAVLARIEGPARELLAAERTALNLLQHLSGIATLTRAYVDAVAGTGAVLLDTRKTIPGLRQLAKYATRMGGAQNHRMRLDDGVLIKDNHIAVCGSTAEAVSRARANGLTDIEVECDTVDQVREAIDAGADSVLLDNMSAETLKAAVAIAAGRVKTEASGGVTLDTIRGLAETGVDFISVGRITQSASAVDIGLDWE